MASKRQQQEARNIIRHYGDRIPGMRSPLQAVADSTEVAGTAKHVLDYARQEVADVDPEWAATLADIEARYKARFEGPVCGIYRRNPHGHGDEFEGALHWTTGPTGDTPGWTVTREGGVIYEDWREAVAAIEDGLHDDLVVKQV